MKTLLLPWWQCCYHGDSVATMVTVLLPWWQCCYRCNSVVTVFLLQKEGQCKKERQWTIVNIYVIMIIMGNVVTVHWILCIIMCTALWFIHMGYVYVNGFSWLYTVYCTWLCTALWFIHMHVIPVTCLLYTIYFEYFALYNVNYIMFIVYSILYIVHCKLFFI